MKHRLILFSLLLVTAAIPMCGAMVMANSGDPTMEPACPAMVQQGEPRLTIPAGSTSASAEQPISGCAGTRLRATGDTLNWTPVVIDAVVHHNQLVLSAYLLVPQGGPTDVTVWRRLDEAGSRAITKESGMVNRLI